MNREWYADAIDIISSCLTFMTTANFTYVLQHHNDLSSCICIPVSTTSSYATKPTLNSIVRCMATLLDMTLLYVAVVQGQMANALLLTLLLIYEPCVQTCSTPAFYQC